MWFGCGCKLDHSAETVCIQVNGWTVRQCSNWIPSGIAPFKWHGCWSCSGSCSRYFDFRTDQTVREIVSLNQVLCSCHCATAFVRIFSKSTIMMYSCFGSNGTIRRSYIRPLRDIFIYAWPKKRWSYRFRCLCQMHFLHTDLFSLFAATIKTQIYVIFYVRPTFLFSWCV